jgi:hypothetical protein
MRSGGGWREKCFYLSYTPQPAQALALIGIELGAAGDI